MALASLFIGMALAHRNVNYAVTVPGPTGPGIAFAAEVLISFVLLTTILNVSNRKNLSRYTGLFAGALVATYITFEAPFSGMSMNPARTFGSAFNARAFGQFVDLFCGAAHRHAVGRGDLHAHALRQGNLLRQVESPQFEALHLSLPLCGTAKFHCRIGK